MTFAFECTMNRDRDYWKTGHRSRMTGEASVVDENMVN